MALGELDYDYTIHNAAQAEADRHLAVRFFVGPLRNEHRSVEEGRPIYEDTVQIEIRVRGDRNNIVIRPVRENDKLRFRDAWRMYQDGAKKLQEGTPLVEWPIMSASMAKELEFLGFHTVEQVAEANDSVCGRIPGLTSMKQKAQHYLEYSKGLAPMEKLQAELEEERSKREAAQAQIEDLGRRLDEMQRQQAAISRNEQAAASVDPTDALDRAVDSESEKPKPRVAPRRAA